MQIYAADEQMHHGKLCLLHIIHKRGGAVSWGTALQGRGFDSRMCHWNFSL